MSSDDELIDRVLRDKDSRAFEILVRRHQQMVRYFLRQLTGWDEALADDLSQEVFLKAWRALARFQRKSKFSTWLCRIAYNAFISDRRRPQQAIDQGVNTPAVVEEPADDPGVETVAQEDIHRDLALAMQALSAQQRSALHLFLHRQCTHQEIAQIMGLPLGTVKTLINRGRAKLQAELAAWQER